MKTILIADDEESLRTLNKTTLEAPGLRILHAAKGEQAMELARAEHPDPSRLDDAGKDSIEVAEALRSDPWKPSKNGTMAGVSRLNPWRQRSPNAPAQSVLPEGRASGER